MHVCINKDQKNFNYTTIFKYKSLSKEIPCSQDALKTIKYNQEGIISSWNKNIFDSRAAKIIVSTRAETSLPGQANK